MIGAEAKRLRQLSGLSQSDFGEAIGLSRETIGRIERNSNQLDRRTELAMRYIVEERLERTPELSEVHEAVEHLLDQTAVRGTPPYDYRDRLQAAVTHWRARHGLADADGLLARAQGVLGMLNVTREQGPLRVRACEDLRELKMKWRAVAPPSAIAVGQD